MEQESPVMLAAFYWKLLAAEGVSPQVQACVGCGALEGLVAFDIFHGGVQCRTCRTGISISQAAIDLLQQVLGGQLHVALSQPESPASFEINQLATQAMEHHIERRLRSVAMFSPRH
jgi:DNA repair protein RecO (recombination protein O)